MSFESGRSHGVLVFFPHSPNVSAWTIVSNRPHRLILWRRSLCFNLLCLISLNYFGSTAFVDLGRFFSFLIYTQSVGLLRREISPSQDRYLHTEQHRQNKHTKTSMPRVGLEPTIPVFERGKTCHALNRVATVVGFGIIYTCENLLKKLSLRMFFDL
jgi:hypothetical protein